MGRITATEFKAKCLDLMNRVAERRETFVITKRGKPVAKLGPIEARAKETLFGCLRDNATIIGDIESPVLPSRAWETVKEWDELSANKKTPRKSRARR